MIQGIRESKLIACIIGGAGLFILIHAVLSPMSHSGMEIYSDTSMLLAILGSTMFTGGFSYVLFERERNSVSQETDQYLSKTSENDKASPDPEKRVLDNDPLETKEKEYDLITRLLSGDERTLFRAIVDSGGEALQKDLILRTSMSNAKVSRILDRFEGMGLVTKERYGSTNRVEIKVQEKA